MLTQTFSRRRFLKFAGAVGLTAALDVSGWVTPGMASPALRSEWTFRDGLPPTGTFETPVLQPDTRFDAVDLSWLSADSSGHGLRFELRVLSKDGEWSAWSELQPDTHDRDPGEPRGYIAPVLRRGQAVQCRVTIEPGAELRSLTIGAFDAAAGADMSAQAVAPVLIDGIIIPRAAWGADEALRHEDRDPAKPIIWPPEYRPIQKIIIHHTVTDNDPPDPAAAIRSIYYYHAVTREWGDIGYNFIVDWDGNIYEGRFGGPNVVGGHALKYNFGSLGIAILGDFTRVEPPAAAIDAIARLVRKRAPSVDVTKASDFINLIGLANLCGHRDVMKTSCPGPTTHTLLPTIRGRIAGTAPVYLDPPVLREWLDLLDCEIGPSTVYPNDLLEVRARIHNPSITILRSCGPEPGYIYDEDDDFNEAGFPKIDGRYRIGIDYSGNTGTANPWRWGFGEPLLPGEEREVVGYVRLRRLGNRSYSASVVKEFVEYLTNGAFPSIVAVAPAPVAPVVPSKDPTSRFYPETGHNVPAPFIQFWDANGGLRRFGYPLTEAFEEVSETDGGRYLTQYFERARFELHPEFAGTPYEVLLGLVGVETMIARSSEPPFQRIAPFKSASERLYFDETGHSLSGIFRRVWEDRGGLPIFGFPISEEFPERSDTDGKWHVVQYFERNRFEWHEDFAGKYDEVMLGHLGREILIRRGWLPRLPG